MKTKHTKGEKRIIEIPAMDYHTRMMFEPEDLCYGMEHYCGTCKAYMDNTSEEVYRVKTMLNKYAYKVFIKPKP